MVPRGHGSFRWTAFFLFLLLGNVSLPAQAGLIEFSKRSIAWGVDSPVGEENRKAIQFLRDAALAHREGNPNKCLSLLAKAKEEEPTLLPPSIAYARLLAIEDDLPGAKKTLQSLSPELRKHPDALSLAAELAFTERRYFDADSHLGILEKNLAGESSSQEDLYMRILHRGRMQMAGVDQNWSNTILEADALLKMETEAVDALQYKARAAFELKNPEKARKLLREISLLDSSQPSAELVLHEFWKSRSNWGKAEAELRQHAAESSEDPMRNLRLFSWLLSSGKLEEASENLQKAEEEMDTTPVLLLSRALLQWRKEDIDSAIGILSRARSTFPEDSQLKRWLAILLAEGKSHEEQSIQKALQIAETELSQTQGGGAMMVTGWVYFHNELFADSEKFLRKSWLLNPEDPQRSYYLATVLAKGGRNEEALALLKPLLSSGRPFLYREEALSLAKSLQ